MALVKCPKCREQLDLDDEYLGQEVDCGACGATFVAQVEGAPRPARREPDADEPPRRRSRIEDDEDYERPPRRSRDDEDDEDFERPRRRRRRSRIEDAPGIVAGPANGLIWTGWLSALMCAFGGLAFAAYWYTQLNNRQMKQDDPEVMMGLGVAVAVLGAPYCILIAVGGHQMKRLRGTAWGYTAGGLGIATIVLCGIICPTTWAGVGFGIWAIVVMSRPEVRDAIEANRRRDSRPEMDDD